MNLSEHFTLEEFTRSSTANEIGNDNSPTPEHLENLTQTAAGMELVRSACGNVPVTVTSGYRNPVVNSAVGGVPNSDHALGWACDFHINGLTPIQAASHIEVAEIKYDQLIHETSRDILHISFNPRMRQEALTQAGGPGTPFTKGIP